MFNWCLKTDGAMKRLQKRKTEEQIWIVWRCNPQKERNSNTQRYVHEAILTQGRVKDRRKMTSLKSAFLTFSERQKQIETTATACLDGIKLSLKWRF